MIRAKSNKKNEFKMIKYILPLLLFSSTAVAKYAHVHFPDHSLLLVFDHHEESLMNDYHFQRGYASNVLNVDFLDDLNFKDKLAINVLKEFFIYNIHINFIYITAESKRMDQLLNYNNPTQEHLDLHL